MANLRRSGVDPFGEMMSLRDAMSSLFEDSFVNPRSTGGQGLSMPLDVAETKDAYVVEAVLPGVKPDDLDITFQDNVLTISGEVRQEQNTGEKANYHRVERRYGRVARSISLPTQVQADKIQANLNHGILRLEIPKAEAVKPRKITVNTGGGAQQAVDVNTEQGQAHGQ
jgi:HSP20 family protein